MKIRKFARWALAGAVSLASTAALASCASVLYSYSSGYYPTAPQDYPECFGASQQTATVSIGTSSFLQVGTISNTLTSRFLASPPPNLGALSSGVAAATPGKAWNVWGNLTNGTTKQDFRLPGSNIKIDTDAQTTVIGGDYRLSPTMVAGVSASFDRSSGDSYNNGAKANSLTNKGYLIAPYIGMSLSKELALDASLGYGQGKLSQTGNVSADADRWFAGANLNYSQWMGNTQLSGRLSYMHGEEGYDNAKANGTTQNNTAAKNKIDRWQIGGQTAWWMNGVMPYVGLAYLTDSRKTSLAGARDTIGKDAWQWSLGVNFLSVASGVTGGIAWQQETSRDNQKQYQLVANIGLRF
jgi:hypothetical protein